MELIKVTTNDNHEQILFSNFEELFIYVSKVKFECTSNELKLIRDDIKKRYFNTFKATPYLLDYIDIEILNLKQIENCRENIEASMQEEVVNNFDRFFPEFNFIKKEHNIKFGRIDLFAEERTSNRPVLIEIKIGNKNPTTQLLGYAKEFINPILIGITENQLSKENTSREIRYFTLNKSTLEEVEYE